MDDNPYMDLAPARTPARADDANPYMDLVRADEQAVRPLRGEADSRDMGMEGFFLVRNGQEEAIEPGHDFGLTSQQIASLTQAQAAPITDLPGVTAEPSLMRSMADAALHPIDSLQRLTMPLVRGLTKADGMGALTRGATAAYASGKHTISDALDQTLQAGPRALGVALAKIAEQRGDSTGADSLLSAFSDPLGFQASADESLAVSKLIGSDRQAAMAAIPRPELVDFISNPSAALETMGARLGTQGAESLPVMAAALATRSPVMASSLLGASTGAQEYTDLRGQGVGRADAAQAGTLSGLAEMAGEGYALPRVMGRASTGSLAGAALAEGAQEFPVSIAQQNIDDNATGRKTPVMAQILDALEAAGVGGLMGGGGHLASNAPAYLRGPTKEAASASAIAATQPELVAALTPSAAPRPASASAPPTRADDATLDALLTQNVPPAEPEPAELLRALLGDDVAAALGLPPIAADAPSEMASLLQQAAPVPDADPNARFRRPESAPAAPSAIAAIPTRTSLPVQTQPPAMLGDQTAGTPAQASAAPSVAVAAGADLDVAVESAKESPIVKFRKEAAAIEAGLSLPAPQTVRLWRGNRPGEVGIATTFTNDLPGIALPFRDSYRGPLSYVDVPASELQNYENRVGTAPGAEFNVPAAFAATAKILPAQAFPKSLAIPRQPAVKTDPKSRKPLDLLRVIAANGGLNRAAFQSQGVDPAELTRRAGFNYLFRKQGGMSLGDLREFMQQENYLQRDSEDGIATVDDNDALDLFDRAFRGGENVYSDDQSEAVAAQMQAQRQADDEYQAELAGAPEFAGDFDPFADDFAPQRDEIARLTERAYDLGATDEEIVGTYFDAQNDEHQRQSLQAIVDRVERNATESKAADSLGQSRAEPGKEAEPASGFGDFTLDAPAKPAAQEVARPSAGLFGAPTARDFVDSAQRARDARRDGKAAAGRTDMLAGDGELFAGKRPDQASVSGEASDGGEGVNPNPAYAPEPSDVREQAGADGKSLRLQDDARNNGARVAPARDDGLDSTDRENNSLAEANAEMSRTGGEFDADELGLRAAVDAVLGPSGSKVEYLRGYDGLPANLKRGVDQRNSLGRKGVTAGLYDPATSRVYLFTDVVTDPARAAWHAAHEIAGHHGLRGLLGGQLNDALELALQNPTVKALADVIATQRKLNSQQRLLAAEEALAELSAAVRTGNFDHITERYNVRVPEGIRSKVAAAIDNFLRRLKALFGRNGQRFTDTDVRELLEAAWQAVEGKGGLIGDIAESVSAQTETPAFKRWFGDSKVVDADGAPLLVHHGTDRAPFDTFTVDPRKWGEYETDEIGAFFTTSYGNARSYGNRVVSAHLSIKNPYETTDREWGLDGGLSPRAAQSAGHDGYIIRNQDGGDTYIAFDPTQVKSATANSGAFDPVNPSILESTDYTPEQVEFMRKAGMGNVVDPRTTMQRVSDWALGKKPDISGDAAIQAGFDQFHGLKRAVNEKGDIDPAHDPYLAARQIQVASTMEAILRFGAPKLVDGALRVDRTIPGLMDALAPVAKQMPQFLGWMVARRAQVLAKQGRENLMTPADIAAGLSLAAGHESAFAKAALGYLKLKNAILDLAEQAGTIDPVARAAWDHAEYVPFYRDTQAGGGSGTRQGLANQSAGIRTLKGGDSALADPLSNIIQNFTKLVDSAMKNRATLLAVDELGPPYFRKAALAMKPETIPLDQVKKHLLANGVDPSTVDAMPDSALKGVAKMLAVKAPEGDDIVRVMRAGKAEYFHVDDPLLLRALTAFNQGPTHGAIRPLIWAKQLLTAGATATPEFLVANTLRDTGEASVTAQDGFIPVWDTVRGAIDSFRDSELAQDLMMAGSAFHSGLFHTGNNEDTAKAIRRALRAHGLTDSKVEKYAKSLINPKRWWDGYRSVAEATEMGSRISLARQRLKAGASFVEAAHEAKDFLDFQMRGDDAFVQFFLKVIPFLNARLQGGYRLARVGTTKGRRGPMAVKLGLMAMGSMALFAWNATMYAAGYDDLEEWDKDANWHVAPGTANHIRIPKPFELGYVGGTLPERMYQAVRYQLTKGEAGDRPGDSFDSLMHLVTQTLALNPIPQGVKPIVEDRANKDFFFDSPIESMGDENKMPADRFNATTSLTMRKSSQAMAAMIGDDNAISPKRLVHLWKGYTAGMGGYVLNATDWALRHATDAPQRPAMALRDFPLIGRFARGDNAPMSTRYTTEFYDLREKITTKSNQVKDAIKDGDPKRAARLEAEWGWLLGDREESKRAKGGFMHTGVRAVEKVADLLASQRKIDQKIYDSRTMSPERKRIELDSSAAFRNAAVKKMVLRIRERERRPR